MAAGGNYAWNAYQQYQVHNTNGSAAGINSGASGDMTGVQTTVYRLEEKIGRLALINRAMYELLKDSARISDEQLAAKVTEIDLRDGREDGKVTPQQKKCPQCDSMICARFNRCLFCGYIDPDGDPFNTI